MNLTRKELEALLRGEKTRRLAAEGFTKSDLSDMMGVQMGAAQKHIAAGVHGGFLEYAGRKSFKRIDGVWSTKPAYRLTKEGKK